MGDLPATANDCKVMLSAWKKYNIHDTGPDGMYNMVDSLTKKKYSNALRHIMKRLRANPDQKLLIHHVYAGHGMNMDGK